MKKIKKFLLNKKTIKISKIIAAILIIVIYIIMFSWYQKIYDTSNNNYENCIVKKEKTIKENKQLKKEIEIKNNENEELKKKIDELNQQIEEKNNEIENLK